MDRERTLYVDSIDGTRIECQTFLPNTVGTPSASSSKTHLEEDVFILIHAHPKLGGVREMMTPLARSLASRGYACVTLSLRGTGGSLGSSSWRGCELEGEDVCACVDAFVGQDKSKRRAHLVGYSYGSTICAYALGKRDSIASYIALGYPRGSYACGLSGIGAKWLMRDHFEALAASAKPMLFVHPSEDNFTTVKTMEELVVRGDKLRAAVVKELKVIEGCDHFELVGVPEYVSATTRYIVDFVARNGSERNVGSST